MPQENVPKNFDSGQELSLALGKPEEKELAGAAGPTDRGQVPTVIAFEFP
jgi:hypothetical protein